MSQYLSKVRQLESDKSEQSSQYQRRLEEFQRDKDQDVERLKTVHRSYQYTNQNLRCHAGFSYVL